MTEQEFAALMATCRQHYRGITQDIELQIFALIEQGMDPQEAVKTILARYPPGSAIKDPLSGLMVTAAINGAGGREGFTASMIDAIKSTLVNLPWAADNMPLSNRLHKLNGVMRQALDNEIHTAMRRGTNWQTLSQQVYDGYGHGGKIKRADDLPKYLKRLQQAARSIIGDDPAAMQAYRKLLRQINRLQTPGLRAAYTKLIDAAKKGTDKAVEKAIKTALEERSRYYAERIARTELARAWADGFYARTLDDPDVIAYRWKLSSNHPVKDICDFHARADLYGLGPGVYPKNKMPPMPAHPHCRCHLTEVFVGELDDKVQDDRLHERGQKFLESLTPAEQAKMLGVEGAKKWRDGGKWEDHLVGWSGHEKPQSRLEKIFSTLPNADKVVIPDAKIFRYILDKTHAVGKHKAIVFDSALGYNQSNGNLLIDAIVSNVKRFKCAKTKTDKYGESYNVIMKIKGANGKTANVLTAWIIRKQGDPPQLTSAYVVDREAKHLGD